MGDVFRLYCSLEAGQTVRDLCMMQDLRAMNVDERYIPVVGSIAGFESLSYTACMYTPILNIL